MLRFILIPLAATLITPSCSTAPRDPSSLGIEFVAFELPVTGHQFQISKYEITNSQYQRFLSETGYTGTGHPSSKPTEPFLGHFRSGRCPDGLGNHPVCNINWWHAKAYCAWLGRKLGRTVRLPTRDEWLFVAAGAENRKYAWGDQWDPQRCNWGSTVDGFARSAPVGSYPNGCTPEGVHDMSGNIWEWCEDQVLRGGPWCMGPDTVTTTFQGHEDRDRADDKFGFRVVVL